MAESEKTGKFDIVVVGIGAMGGGMARALLESDISSTVVGFDLNEQAVAAFHEEATKRSKSSGEKPSTILRDMISQYTPQQPEEGTATSGTNHRPLVVVLSLVNEAQCEKVCFDTEAPNGCLLDLLPPFGKKSCVIMTSTVTSTFAAKADQKFRDKGIYFVDCPVSGGPVRSRNGDLTCMASGSQDSIEYCRPVLQAMARDGDLHLIEGGAGKGSTVKTVHQLLAGVHICAAAEAMAMGERAGLDVEQLYKIVNGAAGASWMFTDRGKRMLPSESEEGGPEVKSALNIFIKDLGIVSGEAQKLDCNTPLATAALNQFKTGQELGFGRQDDSQVIKVYKRQKHNHANED
mmetsp:Transcript_36828/g.89219  ORF Transcript_36828/g.89219 Transcript_36828/m.89219 type:complete len:348 (-) Transcript_36828:7626-8669(-)